MTSPDEIRQIVRDELERLREKANEPRTIETAARMLGLRKARLKALIQQGKIATIPWPGKHLPYRIAVEEIARVQREGIPIDPGPAQPPPRGKKKAGGGTDVAAQLARLKKLKIH